MGLSAKIPLPGAPEYAPYEIPEGATAPPTPPTQTVQNLPGDSSQPGPRYGFGKGASGALGTIAYMLNSSLRGYAQGKANQQAKMAMNIKRTTDGLNMAYQMSAKKYYELYKEQIDAGKKPTDPDFMTPELQQAAAAKDASWAAMMKFMSQNIMGPDGGKKSKGKKGQEAQSPLEGLQSQDPQERAQAWLTLATKMGPDVDMQTRQLSSAAGMAQTKYETTRLENLAEHENIQKELNQLETQDVTTMSEDQKKTRTDRIAQLKDALVASDPKAKAGQTGTKFFSPRPGKTVTGADLKKIYGDSVPGPNGPFTPQDTDTYYGITSGETDGQPIMTFQPMTVAGQAKPVANPVTGAPELHVFNPYTRQMSDQPIANLPQKAQWIKTVARDSMGNPTPIVLPYMPQYKSHFVAPPPGYTFDHPVDVGSQSGNRPVSTEDLNIPTPISSGATDHPQGPTSTAEPKPSTTNAITLASRGYPVHEGKEPIGLIAPGTIDLNNRPILHNPDGTISSELSFSRNQDGREVLVPQIVNGQKLSQDEAWKHYLQSGEHLGKFDTSAHADAYAQLIHSRKMGEAKPPAGTPAASAASRAEAPSELDPYEQAARAAGLPPGSRLFQGYSKPNADKASAIAAQELTLNGKPGSTTDVGLRRATIAALKNPAHMEKIAVAMRQLEDLTKSQAAIAGAGVDGPSWFSMLNDTWNHLPAVERAMAELSPEEKAYLTPNFFRAWTNAATIRALQGGTGKPSIGQYAQLVNELPIIGVNVRNVDDATRILDALQHDVDTAKSRLPQDMQDQIAKDYPRPKDESPAAPHKVQPGGPKKSQEEIMRDLSGQFGIPQPEAHQ